MVPGIERRTDPEAVGRILRRLPEWFGDADAVNGYIARAAELPSYLAVGADRAVIGVTLVERHAAQSAEIHLIAVNPLHHRSGAGPALVSAIESDLRSDGADMLQVHTVGPSYPNDAYARTREFYRAAGFIPLQEFHRIDWDGPTLILVKAL